MVRYSSQTFHRIPRTIDGTPGAGWRRAVKTIASIGVIAVVLPLLWLLGALVLLAVVGGTAVLFACLMLRAAWANRRRAGGGIDIVR